MFVYFSIVYPHEPGPFLLHDGMFVPTIMSQASPQQIQDLAGKMSAFQVIGTYAQTEMGHGKHCKYINYTQDRLLNIYQCASYQLKVT